MNFKALLPRTELQINTKNKEKILNKQVSHQKAFIMNL